MKFELFCITSGRESWADQAEQKYIEKINHYVRFGVLHLPATKLGRDDNQKKRIEDSKQIEKKISPDDFVILFDEKGKNLTSIEFSKLTERSLNSGRKRVVFVIGGPFGVSDQLRQRADQIISLSPFVLNHLVAKTLVLEQIYRAFTILKGVPYHNT